MKQLLPDQKLVQSGPSASPVLDLQPWASGRHGGGSNYGHASRRPGKVDEKCGIGESAVDPALRSAAASGQDHRSALTGSESETGQSPGGQPSTSGNSGMGASEGSTLTSRHGDASTQPVTTDLSAQPVSARCT